MKIHSIISITQLKLTTTNQNIYDKTTKRDSSSIEKNHSNIELIKQILMYEIERLLNKRLTRDYSHYLIK